MAAKIKLTGTRMRVAIRDQLGMAGPQKMPRGRDNVFHADLQQSFFRLTVMGERGLALRMTQHDALCSEGPRSQRIGGAVDGNHGNAQRGSQMQRACVATKKNARPARKRDELPNGATQFECVAAACLYRCPCPVLFAFGHVDQSFYVMD